MDLHKSFSEYNSEIQKATIQYSGLLGLTIGGDRVVNIPSRAGYVYVRLRDSQSEVIQAYNDRVSPVYDFPVLVQRLGNRWIVAGKDTQRYETFGTSAPFLPAHGSQHSFNRDIGTGADTVWVHADQFMPLLVYPSGSVGAGNLMVAPYLLQRESDFTYVGNTGTPNLLAYKPTNNQAIMGLVCINTDTGNPDILIASGTPLSAIYTGTHVIAGYLPYPASNQQPLYAFRLVSGTTRLTWDNLYNARQFFGGTSSGGGATGTTDPGGNDTEIQYNDGGVFGGDSQFTWKDDTKSLGIGEVSKFPFTLEKMMWMTGDGESPSIFGLAYGSDKAPFLTFAKGDGTATGTTNVKTDQVLGRIRGRGYDGTGWSNSQLEIRLVADGDWSAGDHPTRIEVYTTPDGSDTLTLVMTIQSDGNINIAEDKEYRVDGTNVMEGTWLRVPETWTRTGNHSFTVNGDLTAKYRKGAALKYNDGAIDYGRVASSSHSSGTTTVNLIPNTSYVMAATTITDTYISYSQNPEGMPETFNFTSTASSSVGALGAVTQNVGYWALRGKSSIQVTTVHTITDVGTGSGVFRATGPVNAAAYSTGLGRENAMAGYQINTVIDGGSNLIQQCRYDNGSLVVVNYQCAQTTIYPF